MLMDTMRFLDTAGEPKKEDGTTKFVCAAVYDIAGSTLSQPTDGAVLMRFSVNRDFDLPENLSGSKGESVVAPASAASYPIKKNGSQFGTMDFASGINDATFTVTATSFVVGDILTIEAPATADSTHDEISWTIQADLC